MGNTTSTRPAKRRMSASSFATGVALALALTLSACSSSGSGDSKSSGSNGSASGSSDISGLQALVDNAKKVPSFVAPGPAFDTSKLKGKKIFVFPTASQLPVCNQIANDVVALAGKFGMTGLNFQNSGGPSAWIPGMQQAISQKYDAIVLVCGIDPNLIKPQVQAATKAGIAVIDSGLGDIQDGGKSDPLVTAQTNIPNIESIQRTIDVAILDHKGQPFNSFMITTNEVPSGVVMAKAIKDEFAKYCPKCQVKSANVAVPEWATKVQSTVSSALVADPSIKAVIPIFDGEDPPAAAAVKASGKSDVKLYGNYGGTPEYIAQMGRGQMPLATITGPSHLWRAYAVMDQTLRVLSGAGKVSAEKASDPSRLWTPENASENAGVNDGFGTAFIDGYNKIWGIG